MLFRVAVHVRNRPERDSPRHAARQRAAADADRRRLLSPWRGPSAPLSLVVEGRGCHRRTRNERTRMTTRNLEGQPKTEASLWRDLVAIGVTPEMTLLVHSSLSSIGWVVGGAPTVVRALLQVLGERGTLVMPAATPHCADPATWAGPRVPEAWLAEVREHLPIFDRRTTPTARGAICEAFRTWPGTLRSNHPVESVCARGVAASATTGEHPLAFSEGRGGPFEKLYDLDCRVLLLGVGFNRCTALHYAESLVDKRRVKTLRFPVLDNGRRVWTEVANVADDNDRHFPVVGRKYGSSEVVRKGKIGDAESLLFPMRGLVDFAVRYFDEVL